ncbi:3-dehydroquinate synthase [Desulfopila sp. IMCC35006]|uniref:3-dehydroquinate synthase n=1 Tax=Desulfopila sp. IMCC35006 TaxID=2569542 RepID=UPI0010ABEAB5|nr:3-dehydroquinate synthase [Desulfopila sp. IMCC35006]TKB28348.1 3-dehydroquinate synthase [Desulfopila sp. IMCC35006]
MQTLEQQFSIHFSFPVIFDRDIFQPENQQFASVLLRGGQKCHRVLCFIDSGVLRAHPSLPQQIGHYAEAHSALMQLCGPVETIQGGESCKNEPAVIDKIMRCVQKYHMCRHSFILAIGGGAVLDAVGYGAAIAHRGLRLLRMPTTVLGQNDAGVGVKNGVNGLGRKNFIGTFAPPFAVINDFGFLDSLSPRELRAGMAEAVKVALIKDRAFFSSLFEQRFDLASFARGPMEEMIYRCAALHMQHIGTGGDPFELGSARPLDFGHWSAHTLEEMTSGLVHHGEAVAIGLALDSLYSCYSGMIEEDELRRIFTLIVDLGLPLYHPALAELDVEGALDSFREHLGGKMAITLLTGIGSKKEVDRIDAVLMGRCIDELMAQDSSKGMRDDQTAPHPVHGQIF